MLTHKTRNPHEPKPNRHPNTTQRTDSAQLQMFREEEWDDLPLVNALRADVERWRDANYRNATPVTRELLRHWARDDLLRRLFFCQREVVETFDIKPGMCYGIRINLSHNRQPRTSYEGKLYGTFETVRPVVDGTL